MWLMFQQILSMCQALKEKTEHKIINRILLTDYNIGHFPNNNEMYLQKSLRYIYCEPELRGTKGR